MAKEITPLVITPELAQKISELSTPEDYHFAEIHDPLTIANYDISNFFCPTPEIDETPHTPNRADRRRQAKNR
jgi:hypothetical protein